MRPDFLAARECSYQIQPWRKNGEIRVHPDAQRAFVSEADRACGILCRHRYGFMQWNIHLTHHRTDEVDHAGGAAYER